MTITTFAKGDRILSTLTVSAVARQISQDTGTTVPPHVVSTLFYKRRLDDVRCPIVGGRRLIPQDYVPAIREALQEQGVLPREDAAS